MTPARLDLVVVGAGPAGAACALEAAALGLAVALVDPRTTPTDAPCGEGIMPSGVHVLRALGAASAVAAGRPFAGVRHVVAGAPPLSIDLPRPGVALRRGDLLAHLDAAVAATARVRRVHAPARVHRRAEGFAVAAGDEALEARCVVGADGAAGGALPELVRDDAGARRAPGRFGLRARFAERAPLDRVEVHLGRGCEVYLTPLPRGEVNVAVLFERAPQDPRGPAALLAWALARHPAAAAHLGEEVTPPTGRGLVRRVPRAPSARGGFLVGDAAGAVDPIVGCGVAIALRTGVLAARGAAALARGADAAAVDARYARHVRAEAGARHALATLLRRGDGHPRLARWCVATLARLPRAARALARIAGGR